MTPSRDTTAAVGLDPVTLTVLDNYLTSTCRDMGVTMMTTAYSPIFNESLDFSCVIFDPRGQMLAQAEFCPSQIGTIKFTVEWTIAELGLEASGDQLFRITFDGIIVDEDHFSVLGGESEPVADRLKESWSSGLSLADALRTARAALAGPDRTLEAGSLEVAVLTRGNGRRAFGRIVGEPLAALLT